MSPVDFTLLAVCALLLAVAAGAVVALRQVARRSSGLEHAVERLRQQVEELCRREAARETAEAAARSGGDDTADYVITFDHQEPTYRQPAGRREPTPTVSAPQVVSTALGEPLIKAAALSHGVRQALREERRAHLAYQVRREYRRRRRASRATARAAQRSTAQRRTSP